MYTIVIKQNGKVATEEVSSLSKAKHRLAELESDFKSSLTAVVLDKEFNMVMYKNKDQWSNAFRAASEIKEYKKYKPKSCIYCGSKGALRYAYFGQWRGYQFRVECENPECTGDPPEFSTTPEEAIELWDYKR